MTTVDPTQRAAQASLPDTIARQDGRPQNQARSKPRASPRAATCDLHPRPACGERAGVRGNPNNLPLREEATAGLPPPPA